MRELQRQVQKIILQKWTAQKPTPKGRPFSKRFPVTQVPHASRTSPLHWHAYDKFITARLLKKNIIYPSHYIPAHLQSKHFRFLHQDNLTRSHRISSRRKNERGLSSPFIAPQIYSWTIERHGITSLEYWDFESNKTSGLTVKKLLLWETPSYNWATSSMWSSPLYKTPSNNYCIDKNSSIEPLYLCTYICKNPPQTLCKVIGSF